MDVISAHQLYLEPIVAAGVKIRRPSTTMGVAPMAPQKITKHELKTRETRELLLQSAEKIFVRDGYESADLVEIAELAGRTKGAIYAQFKSKEEVFLALVERTTLQRRAKMRELLEKSTSLEDNLAALREFCISLVVDDAFGGLLLEFRLYTIRHPDVRERLADLYRTLMPADEEAAYTEMLGSPGRGKKVISRSAAVHSAFAMIYALQVEMKFHPNLYDTAMAKTIAARVFDAIFSPPEN